MMKKTTLLSAGCAVALLALSGMTATAAVVPGDTFSFGVFGGTNDDQSLSAFPIQDVAFGTAKTYAGIGINGQDISITSNEVIGATTTTDTILVSTPVGFYTQDNYNGSPVSRLVFRLGDMYSGSDPLRLQRFTGILNLTGYITYSGGTLPLNPGFMLGQDSQSFTADEFIFTSYDADAPPINQFNVNSFSFILSYPNAPAAVPEPTTAAALGFGALSLGAAGVRRWRKAGRAVA